MVNRVTGVRGPTPAPERGRPQLSKELKKVLADTVAVVKNVRIGRFEAKLEGYAKGSPNSKAAKREENVAKRNMLKWKGY